MISGLAIHEAGHAVVGRKLGMICGQASIIEDIDSAGHSLTADPYAIAYHWDQCGHFREFQSVLRARIMTFMAGREAELEISGICQGGDGDDVFQVGLMIAELAEDDEKHREIESRLRHGTQTMVRRHRRTIADVAHVLERQGTMSADELDRLSPGPVRFPLAEAGTEVGAWT